MPGAAAIARKVRRSPGAAQDFVARCLEAIEGLDGDIRAWAWVDGAGARRSLAALSRRRLQGAPLAGVPVGVKDIIDVAGMPTRSGAAEFAHRRPAADAEAVARLRRAGAVIVGKTATTEFAYLDPAETRNPWNLDHTPGGSSSGSAAAVAAGMVPLALGTQTVGSVLRPAAYCGVVGFKPSYAAISLSGVLPLASSFDHLGLFATSVGDIALGFSVVCRSARLRRELRSPRSRRPAAKPRIALVEGEARDAASDEVVDSLLLVARLLEEDGWSVAAADIPPPAEWLARGRIIMAAEAAAFHEPAYSINRPLYRPRISDLIEAGLTVGATAYLQARRELEDLRARLLGVFRSRDLLLLPVAPTTAPVGLGSTGDPAFCAPASFAGLPAISLPSGLDGKGLPLAVQLVAGPGRDGSLLEAAARLEKLLGFHAHPPHFARWQP